MHLFRQQKQRALKGHGFSRAVTCASRVGLQPLRELALRLNTEVPQWLKPPLTAAGYGTAEAVPLQSVRSSSIIQEGDSKSYCILRVRVERRFRAALAGNKDPCAPAVMRLLENLCDLDFAGLFGCSRSVCCSALPSSDSQSRTRRNLTRRD